MTKDEALKLALEALEKVTTEMLKVRDELAERGARPETNAFHQRLWDSSFKAYTDHALPAATAIKEALAQTEQEPVAWGFRDHDGVIYDCISPEAHADCEGEYNVPLYDAPPKRPWVGLTDEEAQWLYDNCRTPSNLIDMTEAKLQEKNT